jgi:hypothetical protein
MHRQCIDRVIQSRAEMTQVLWIWHKDVDVLAEAMPIATHEYRAATEAPPLRREYFLAGRIDDQKRFSK